MRQQNDEKYFLCKNAAKENLLLLAHICAFMLFFCTGRWRSLVWSIVDNFLQFYYIWQHLDFVLYLECRIRFFFSFFSSDTIRVIFSLFLILVYRYQFYFSFNKHPCLPSNFLFLCFSHPFSVTVDVIQFSTGLLCYHQSRNELKR